MPPVAVATLDLCNPAWAGQCPLILSLPVPGQDILQPQHEKKQIGVHYKWEDINVSTNVVLRTALPSAPPRVPQLVLSESHADARTIHDLGPSIAHTTQATRPARALVSEVYTAETATLGSDEVPLLALGLPAY